MNILQLCHKVPYPPKDGGCIAVNNLTEGLSALGHKVKVLAINTPKHYTDIEELPSAYRQMTAIEAIDVDTRVKPVDAFCNLFTSESYNITRFYSREFEQKLEEVLAAGLFDVVQLESLFMAPYIDAIRKSSNVRIVLRSHNVEFRLWERVMEQSSFPKKSYIRMLAKRLKDYEVSMLNRYDAVAAITPEDAVALRKLGCRLPVIHIPFGIDIEKYSPAPLSQPLTLFHIGAMDWTPNIQAVEWFLENVWDGLLAKHPRLELHLAGRKMPSDLKGSNKKNVIIAGEVDNAISFMQKHTVMIAPFFSGGGMRVKMIEAMALGRTVVSTAMGAEGISGEHEKHLLIANTPHEFIEAIGKCIADAEHYRMIGENARKLVQDQYDNKKICERLAKFYEEATARPVNVSL